MRFERLVQRVIVSIRFKSCAFESCVARSVACSASSSPPPLLEEPPKRMEDGGVSSNPSTAVGTARPTSLCV